MDLSETKNLPKVDHTPAVLDEQSKLLLKTADVIEQYGWCQNEYRSPDGRHCILGAMRVALGLSMADSTGHHPIAEPACERLYNSLGNRVNRWNDAPGRTQAEVVAKLRAVALGL